MFFVTADAAGDGFDRGAQSGDVVGQAGECAGRCCAVSVFIDEGSQGGVAVERGPAGLGPRCDGGEGDGLAFFAELGPLMVDVRQSRSGLE